MTLPDAHDTVIEQGKNYKRWFAVVWADAVITPGQPPNATQSNVADLVTEGYTVARFTVVPEYGSAPVVDLTAANGEVVLSRVSDGATVNPLWWSGYISMSAAATALLSPWGRGPYELEISNGTDKMALFRGTAVLEQEPTR